VEKVTDADEVLLQKCKHLIETKLGWEESTAWTNHDFLTLAAKIQDATGVNLSVATLKRIWGKVKYESKPTITTLNTLAQFTGFENWRAFKQQHAGHARRNGVIHELPPEAVLPSRSSSQVKTQAFRSGLIGTALCGGIVFILWYMVRNERWFEPVPKSYSFSSKKVVSEGVPNSVIFDYDASAANTDSIFIQQSWDPTLRTKVSPHENQHTSIYYTPGFFQAKLVVGDEIVREHNLLITSKGWIALVDQDPVPVYFDDADFRRNGMLSLPVGHLKDNNISLQPELPATSYYNVKDFGDLRTDNFTFETEVRNDFREGAGVCQQTRILLLTEGNVIIIPLSIKGCVSDLGLMFNGEYIDGKKSDLSAFGADLSKWVKIRCEVKDRKGRIFINDVLAYESSFTSAEKIVGIIYRFQGTGSVDRVSLVDGDGEKVFYDDF
jgi:hypothetical protein